MGDVARSPQPHHGQACSPGAFVGSRGRFAAIAPALVRMHASYSQAYTESDAQPGTIADCRRRLDCHSGRVRVAGPKARPASGSFARRHCLERQTYFRLLPISDLPAAQRDTVADSVCAESLSPLKAMRLRRTRGIQASAVQRDARLILAILGELFVVRPKSEAQVRCRMRIPV